ncbi:type II toxin-antitoxin system PemK/MazF family toxin [Candidatus Deferrimicrobium sp.]|uniref:type II toxin-antitoxin system PemK/MazF family toxin n=1 Tax=Candidatus Deferrimicrobium sp. TaxID=3060586 RepID=UPI002726B96A|nr:type II toxin-antitoxin system PemK/MazF family toxin [Candidatus Deferrimicrobium sp.]MDO8739067.1 type II toxin-antitoxin system PemK/MazF family toxin [Candidatus Deferrimicrobium sp.]
MDRGDVWWVNLEPSIGGEIRKKRPAIIVSNNAANKFLNRVQVIPITSNTDRLFPSEAYVTVAGKKGKAMADQLATVSKQRLTKRIGSISDDEMNMVAEAIKTQLDLF